MRAPSLGRFVLLLCSALCVLGSDLARAQEPSAEPIESDPARLKFDGGVNFQKNEDWNHALAAFRDALALAKGRRIATIRFNVAVCERALGHFLAARRELLALTAVSADLEPSRAEEVARYLREMKSLIVELEVELIPETASLSVDGGPLLRDTDGKDQYTAGLSHDSSQIRSVRQRSFVLYLDPGAHIFRANRAGHADVVLVRSYHEGEHSKLKLELDLLPATIAVRSEPSGAIVRVDEREVGVTPLELQRTAGTYRLEVDHADYDLHTQQVSLQPGEHVDITAPLDPYEPPLTARWWFWAGVVAVTAGAAVLTYAVTRPEPEVPPYDGGSSGWVARAR